MNRKQMWCWIFSGLLVLSAAVGCSDVAIDADVDGVPAQQAEE